MEGLTMSRVVINANRSQSRIAPELQNGIAPGPPAASPNPARLRSRGSRLTTPLKTCSPATGVMKAAICRRREPAHSARRSRAVVGQRRSRIARGAAASPWKSELRAQRARGAGGLESGPHCRGLRKVPKASSGSKIAGRRNLKTGRKATGIPKNTRSRLGKLASRGAGAKSPPRAADSWPRRILGERGPTGFRARGNRTARIAELVVGNVPTTGPNEPCDPHIRTFARVMAALI